jgi:hypothetical protein
LQNISLLPNQSELVRPWEWRYEFTVRDILKSDEAFFHYSLFIFFLNVLTRLFEKRGNPWSRDLIWHADDGRSIIASFIIHNRHRYHVKLMPLFDIITSMGFIKTIFRYSFEYLLQTRHFNARLQIENTSSIRWKFGKCEHRSFSLASWENDFDWLMLFGVQS